MTPGGGAHVGSLAAVRDFRAAMVTFLHEAREALASHDLELRRSLEWILEAEPARWQHEIRRLQDEVTEAKIELERCRHSKLPGGETPSCMEERKLLERARQRLDLAEQKLEATRKWGRAIELEAAEYQARANQLSDLVEADAADAVSLLDRVLTSLEAYVAAPAGGESLREAALAGGATTSSIVTPNVVEAPEPTDDPTRSTEEN